MSIDAALSKLEEAQKKSEGAEPEGPKVKNDKTLRQIRENPQDFDRFGKFLDQESQGGLGEKFLKAKDHPEQMDRQTAAALAEQKEKFLVLMERSENAIKSLDAKTIQKLAESIPELKNLIELGGPESLQRALKSQLPEMAIQDRGRFEALAGGLERLAELKKRHEEDEKEIKECFEEYNITSEDEIAGILHGNGDVEDIVKDITKKNGWFKRRLGMAPKAEDIQKKIRNLIGKSKDAIEQNRDEIKDAMAAIGGALEVSLMDNKAVHDAMVADLYGGPIEKPAVGMSFAEAGEAMTVDQAAAKAAWEQKRAEQKKMFVEQSKKEWLDEKRETALQELLKAQTRRNAEEELQGEGVPAPIPEDVVNERIAVLDARYATLSEARKKKISEDLLADASYQNPKPDAALIARWEAEAERLVTVDPQAVKFQHKSPRDIDWLQQEAFYENFERDYATEHMKGKKGGFWSSIASEFFKQGLFEGIFSK
jgi:frataxin-like iron-binding protein CyaY